VPSSEVANDFCVFFQVFLYFCDDFGEGMGDKGKGSTGKITGASRGLSSRARKKVQRLATAKEMDASASNEGKMEAVVRALARARGALAREKGPNDDPIAL
jgi:hypothetical protein